MMYHYDSQSSRTNKAVWKCPFVKYNYREGGFSSQLCWIAGGNNYKGETQNMLFYMVPITCFLMHVSSWIRGFARSWQPGEVSCGCVLPPTTLLFLASMLLVTSLLLPGSQSLQRWKRCEFSVGPIKVPQASCRKGSSGHQGRFSFFFLCKMIGDIGDYDRLKLREW